MTGIVGNSGTLGHQGLLDMALRLSCTGTLVERYEGGSRLVLLDSGRLKSTFELGQPGAAEESEVDFHFEAHGPGDIPQLSSLFPESLVGVLRALPTFGPAQALPPGIVDLRALVARARERGWSGAVTVRHDGEAGIALIHEGLIGAAFFEREGHVWERGDALRGLYRYSLEAERPPLLSHSLFPGLVRSLLGLALESRAGSGNPNRFSGVSAGEGGYTFYEKGTPVLHLAAQLLGGSGRFAHLETVPDLELPEDPPGWERRCFDLTLRGRDALNPMTELSMEFSDSYGTNGRRVLEAVRRGLSIEDAAARLGLDLQALKPWIERLETDGLIRLRR